MRVDLSHHDLLPYIKSKLEADVYKGRWCEDILEELAKGLSSGSISQV